jgi:hypothetical protein
MIKNFKDRDNKIYNILMRGRLQDSVKSSLALRRLIDNSTSKEGLKKIHPSYNDELINRLYEAYQKKTYREIMSLFGIVSYTYLISQ